MQVLLSQAALDRVGDRLTALGASLDFVAVQSDGTLKRDGACVDAQDVDPEVFWVSQDIYRAGAVPKMFDRVLNSPGARWVQVSSAGIDNPIFKAIMARGVRVSKSSAQAPAIAEYIMAHALSLLHPIEAQRQAQDEAVWRKIGFREIASTRWLMIGYGSIGHAVAARLKPFGAHLTVVRRHAAPDPLVGAVGAMADLPVLLPDADVVILACALNDQTRGVAGRAFFQALRPGAILINIARGGLVDEAALKDGLDRDQPARAVLDVFAAEPLPPDAWFWAHPKVRVTAHTSFDGENVRDRMETLFVENLRRYLAGEPLLHEASRAEVGL
jgi:phosphoglycerate dehydrogenase-like enzyme